MGKTRQGTKQTIQSQSSSRKEDSTPGSEERALGHTIRGWRTGVGQTLAQLAEATDLSIGYLSQIERGLANPSLAVLKRLAVATNHSLGELLEPGSPGERPSVHLVRGDRDRDVALPPETYRLRPLHPDFRANLDLSVVIAAPGASSGVRFHDHDQDQCTLVIEGQAAYYAGDEQYELGEDDAVYVRAGVPHRWVNNGPGRLRLLVTRPTAGA